MICIYESRSVYAYELLICSLIHIRLVRHSKGDSCIAGIPWFFRPYVLWLSCRPSPNQVRETNTQFCHVYHICEYIYNLFQTLVS